MAYKHYFFTYAEQGFPCLHGPFDTDTLAAADGMVWQHNNNDDPRWHCVELSNAEARIWLQAVDDTAQAWVDDIYNTPSN